VFEITIRIVGGLLAAHSLSKDKVFLDRAAELAAQILRAFHTPSGVPYGRVTLGKLASSAEWRLKRGVNQGGNVCLAEIGTLQLELRYLTKHTGDPSFAKAGDAVYTSMGKMFEEGVVDSTDGLWPIELNPRRWETNHVFASRHITWGGQGDSFYEYLLKCWVQVRAHRW
jgi:mannosyl-oligosaccharide alpha-1,2-mannosidase